MNAFRRAVCAALLGASVLLLAAACGGSSGGDSGTVNPPPPPPPPPPAGQKIRFVNFTNNPIVFEGGGETTTVPPQSTTDPHSVATGPVPFTARSNQGDGSSTISGSVNVAAGEVGLVTAFAGVGSSPLEQFVTIKGQPADAARVTFSAYAYRDNSSFDVYVLAPGTPIAGATPLFTGVTYRAAPVQSIHFGTYAVTVVNSGTMNVVTQSGPIAITDGQDTAIVLARDFPLRERLLVVNLGTATYYPDVRP
ncbi:hypothetical protein DSM104443_04030 [Usitatibacter rugosus]|uniref:DUF4397 domain-containing protein n=1 Tax=Usitatibacter rugosus TaxID=2732067 RepID=A0A6M4H0C6_9PROT|nr:hypothetical protein [Usitatibacter rugosus]QJR12936.1 hypothetical protein DSM104443_04030 [Usitatibacter rugosus]